MGSSEDPPRTPPGEATQVERARAALERAEAGLQRADEASQRSDERRARSNAARERSRAALRRMAALVSRGTASGLREPLGEQELGTNEQEKIASQRDNEADERERIAYKRDETADKRDRIADDRDRIARAHVARLETSVLRRASVLRPASVRYCGAVPPVAGSMTHTEVARAVGSEVKRAPGAMGRPQRAHTAWPASTSAAYRARTALCTAP
jgi:hypothetical protein